MLPKNPKLLSELTVAECEDIQKAMLYPWEVAAWADASLDLTEGTARAILMDRLDTRIFRVEAEEARRNGEV